MNTGTAPVRMTTRGVIGKLNAEWTHRLANRTAHYGSLGQLSGSRAVTLLQGSTAAERDRLFYAMLSAAASGNQAAERTLLQAMLPKTVQFTRTCKGLVTLAHQDAQCHAVAAMWEAIRTYPLHQTQKVCATLVLNALRLITNSHPAPSQRCFPTDDATLDGILTQTRADHGDNPLQDKSAFEELITVIGWATDHGVLRPDEAKLLGRYTVSTNAEKHALADELGRTRRALGQRIYQIHRKLAAGLDHFSVSRGDLV
jgi:hypothetical protein